ncbi:Uncharacterised protein [Enterococcus casseliflavus]|nr:hypothetical protein ECA02_34230 [Enterococcus casseliflavus]STP33432.1 Uncharacterised protein [Enterococcus casseliflavus]
MGSLVKINKKLMLLIKEYKFNNIAMKKRILWYQSLDNCYNSICT